MTISMPSQTPSCLIYYAVFMHANIAIVHSDKFDQVNCCYYKAAADLHNYSNAMYMYMLSVLLYSPTIVASTKNMPL